MSPQCRAFTRALQTKNVKAPPFADPYGREFKMTGALVFHIFIDCNNPVLRKPGRDISYF